MPHQYSKHATSEFLTQGIPTHSFPFTVKDFPENTKYFAFSFLDHDSYPLVSFSWVHWLAVNVEAVSGGISENLKKTSKTAIFGQNSFASSLRGLTDTNITWGYAGLTPPNADHKYTLSVHALSEKIDLKSGFFYNEFLDEVQKKSIAMAEANVIARI